MSRAPLRAGLIGAGLMGRWHAHAMGHLGVRLVAVADVQFERAQRLARARQAQACASFDELLSRESVDVLHICTPLDTHVDYAARALDTGIHVLVEKPLAPDAGSTAQLLACARDRQRFVQPVHQFIFQPGVQGALAHLQRIAPLVHVEFSAYTAGGNGDALLADVLPHALALLARIVPGGLAALQWHTLHPQIGELRASAEADGCSFVVNISTHGRPTQNLLTLVGAHGTVYADLYHGFAVQEDAAVSRARKLLHPFTRSARVLVAASTNLGARALRREPAYPGLRALMSAFYTAIQNHTPPPFSDDEILAVARARDTLIACLASS